MLLYIFAFTLLLVFVLFAGYVFWSIRELRTFKSRFNVDCEMLATRWLEHDQRINKIEILNVPQLESTDFEKQQYLH